MVTTNSIFAKLDKPYQIKAKLLGIDELIGKESVVIGGIEYDMEPFDAREIIIWLTDFDDIIAPVKRVHEVKSNGEVVSKLEPLNVTAAVLRAKARHIFAAGQIAKKEIGGQFAGYKAVSDQLGFRITKAPDVMRTSDTVETPAGTWEFTFTAGESPWIGYGTNYSNPITIDKFLCVCVVGVANLSDTQVVEQIQFKVGDQDRKPVPVKPQLSLADAPYRTPVTAIPTEIWKPRDNVLGKSYCSASATNELVLIGVTYGKGSKLQPFVPKTVET